MSNYRFLGIDVNTKRVVQFVDPAITLTKISGVTLTGRDWSQDLARLQNIDRSLLMVKRELVSFAPTTGNNANLPVDDYNHWVDTSEYSVTETTWTTKTRVVIRPRNMPRRTYIIHMAIYAKVTTGQTIYVRFRSHYRGVLWSTSTSSTTYALLEGNATYVAPGWHDDPIYVETYVTGGTGYISSPAINLVSTNVVEGWTYSIEGEQFRPIMVDSSGRVVIYNPNLDVALTTLARLQRWGRDVTPFWVHGSEVTAPSAGTALVSRTVTSGRQGFIYGFYIMASEPNDFRVNWTSGGTARSVRIPFTSAGALHFADFVALNEGLPADGGTTISITNVNAGSSGSTYQARLLVAEL